MAKISARGAREVARLKVRSAFPGGGEYLYVMTTDGRVLRRATGDAGTGYTVRLRVKDPAKRTEETLRKVTERDFMAPA